MVRDFSEMERLKLIQITEDVKCDKLFDKAVDFLHDSLILNYADLIGELDIANFLNYVDAYHTLVIDKNNTKAKDINKIFEDVRGRDANYAGQFGEIKEAMEQYRQAVAKYADAINPNMKLSPTEITASCDEAAGLLASANERVSTVYDRELYIAEQRELENGAKEFIGDMFSVIGSLASLPGALLKGDVGGLASEGLSLVDGIFNLVNDGGALIITTGSMVLGIGEEMTGKRDFARREAWLSTASDARTTEGLTGTLEKCRDVSPDGSTGQLIFAGIAGAAGAAYGMKEIFDFFGGLEKIGDRAEKKLDTMKEMAKTPFDKRMKTGTKVKRIVSGGVNLLTGINLDERKIKKMEKHERCEVPVKNANAIYGLIKGAYENRESGKGLHDVLIRRFYKETGGEINLNKADDFVSERMPEELNYLEMHFLEKPVCYFFGTLSDMGIGFYRDIRVEDIPT